MNPYLQDADLTLYQGDAREVLRGLPDESVHMCVTSPPFYGLRDYGTGRWEGGNPDCDHVERTAREGRSVGTGRHTHATFHGSMSTTYDGGHVYYGRECGKCGASRVDQQIGLEETLEQWVAALVGVFREVRRVLRGDGTCWVEVGDSYAANRSYQVSDNKHKAHDYGDSNALSVPAGLKPKDLIGAPWKLAFALQADGWYLRSDIVWSRPNPMPESVTDRPTKSHSYVFLLSKSPRYFFDQEAVREITGSEMSWAEHEERRNGWKAPETNADGVLTSYAGSGKSDGGKSHPAGRNVRSVWSIPTQAYSEAHFATFPEELVRRCILAGSSERGCCLECGAPWEREVERELVDVQATNNSNEASPLGWDANRTHPRASIDAKTLGWDPGCSCRERDFDGAVTAGGVFEPIPCTVLDPFAGSGTTGLVARKHGRRSILIELSADYCELVAKRTQQLSLEAEPA